MTNYENIQLAIEKCIVMLEPFNFTNGNLKMFEEYIKNITCCTQDILVAVIDLDERVTELEL